MTGNSHRPAERIPRPIVLPRLYAIVDVDMCRLRAFDPLRLVEACAAGGARLLQVRQKGTGSGALLSLASAAVRIMRSVGGIAIVNDRADLAVMAGADGVHVGQHDLTVAAVHRILPPGALVGVSTHTTEQIDEGLRIEADYVAVGPVFRTATKETGYDPRGLEMVRYAARGQKPVVGIGGITLDTAPEVLRVGAASVAVISDLLAGADPETRVRRYLDVLG